jgi:hypothetical protein
MALIAKRLDQEKKLSYQKKAQAASSIAGSTVGLAGLGTLLASRKMPSLERHLPKIAAIGGGIGGVSGYNFASIQNQESKKKPPRQNVYVVRNKKQIKSIKSGLEPVKKGLDTMDFGLGDVHQGQNLEMISKWAPRKPGEPITDKTGKNMARAGYLGTAATMGALALGKPKAAAGLGAATIGTWGTHLNRASSRAKSGRPPRGAKPLGTVSKRKWDTPESEAKQQQAERTGKQAATAGTVGSAGALTWYGSRMAADLHLSNKYPGYKTQKYNLKGQSKNMREAYTTATKAGWKGADPIKRRQTVKPLLKFGARAVKNNPHAVGGKVGGAAALAGIGTSWALQSKSGKERNAAASMRSANRRQQLKKQPVSKSSDWMNISEHQRRAADSRRTSRRGDRAVGWAGAGAGLAVAHSTTNGGRRFGSVGQQASNFKEYAGNTPGLFKRVKDVGGTKEAAKVVGNSWKAAAKNNPHATALVAAGGLAAAGASTHIAGRVNEKRHNRAIAVQRRKRVAKAYNPEDKRHRRLDTAATSLSAAAGATGVGAAYQAKQAFGKKPYSYQVPSNRKGGQPKVMRNVGSGLRSETLGSFGGKGKTASGFKGGVKSAGKAGALGLTAVGLAVGSDRVRQYKSGRGNSYRPLLRHT